MQVTTGRSYLGFVSIRDLRFDEVIRRCSSCPTDHGGNSGMSSALQPQTLRGVASTVGINIQPASAVAKHISESENLRGKGFLLLTGVPAYVYMYQCEGPSTRSEQLLVRSSFILAPIFIFRCVSLGFRVHIYNA